MKIEFPYGKRRLAYDFEDAELSAILTSQLEDYNPPAGEGELVEAAMENPIGSAPLWQLARGKDKVVIIASDHTRPVPSKIIMPRMLAQIRRGNPNADITILIATGCHRGTTPEELEDKFGKEVVSRERIVVHDCDESEVVNLGALPSGGQCYVNRLAVEADLLVAEGFIEPHFFAGFSGGRKSILPGIAGRTTVLANHCSEFIDHPKARTGSLEGNPIHEDMVWAAKQAGLTYIVNVVLNGEKKVIHAVAGDCFAAHKAGTDFLSKLCGAEGDLTDIVITTNGGYPLDQNVYQAPKGMTAGEAVVKPGGIIIMLAQSSDGTGGDHFYHQLADEPDMEKTMALFRSRSREQTVPDQWQTQVLLRVLSRAQVIYVSDLPDEMVKKMHMLPAHSVDEALTLAKALLGKASVTITAIPDGIGVVVNAK